MAAYTLPVHLQHALWSTQGLQFIFNEHVFEASQSRVVGEHHAGKLSSAQLLVCVLGSQPMFFDKILGIYRDNIHLDEGWACGQSSCELCQLYKYKIDEMIDIPQ